MHGTAEKPDIHICLMCFTNGRAKEFKMSWNDVIGKGGGRENYLQIKENQTTRVHLLLDDGEEPISYWTHFMGRGQRSIICPGRDVCPACKDGVKGKRQHAVNVWDYDSSSVKILQQGNSVFQQIKMIYDQYGSLNEIDVSIKRIGGGLNTQYLVIPLPLTAPFNKQYEKFDIDILIQPDSPEKASELMTGGEVAPEDTKVSKGPLHATSTSVPPVRPIGADPHDRPLTFGKYKGKTIAEIAIDDYNYVKWLAENVSDERIKGLAKEYTGEITPVDPTPLPTNGDIKPLVDEAYQLINFDPKFKGRINDVARMMTEATQTPTNPKGKMVLQNYTEQEVRKLLELLKK